MATTPTYPLSYHQEQRIVRMRREPLFLLDYVPTQDTQGEDPINILAQWKISGSTKNVYTVTLYMDHAFWCDCPDMKSYSNRHKCVCKHICFVLIKVGKLSSLQHFFNVLHLSSLHVEELLSRMNQGIWKQEKEVVDETLIQAFQRLCSSSAEDKNAKEEEENLGRPISEEDDCPICYDPLLREAGNRKDLLTCGTCRNHFHKECLLHWLSVRTTCAYCRSSMNDIIKTNTNMKEEGSTYINLDSC